MMPVLWEVTKLLLTKTLVALMLFFYARWDTVKPPQSQLPKGMKFCVPADGKLYIIPASKDMGVAWESNDGISWREVFLKK